MFLYFFYNEQSQVVVDFFKETTEVLGAFRQFPSETGAIFVLSDGLLTFKWSHQFLGQVLKTTWR